MFVLVFGECLGIFKGVWQIFLGCQSRFLELIGEGRVFVRVFLRFGRFLEVFGEGGAVSKFRGEKGGGEEYQILGFFKLCLIWQQEST